MHTNKPSWLAKLKNLTIPYSWKKAKNIRVYTTNFRWTIKKSILGSSFGRRVKPQRQRIHMKTSYGRSVFDGFQGLDCAHCSYLTIGDHLRTSSSLLIAWIASDRLGSCKKSARSHRSGELPWSSIEILKQLDSVDWNSFSARPYPKRQNKEAAKKYNGDFLRPSTKAIFWDFS